MSQLLAPISIARNQDSVDALRRFGGDSFQQADRNLSQREVVRSLAAGSRMAGWFKHGGKTRMETHHNAQRSIAGLCQRFLRGCRQRQAGWLQRCGLAVATLASATVFSATAFAAAQPSSPLTTNTPSFRIPFAVESAGAGSVMGSAILFASRDGGPFEQVQRVPAAENGFQFNAPRDGRYAFAVRITDASGQLAIDSQPLTPELEVTVDTTAPGLELQLSEKAPGQVHVLWQCSEASVAPGSLRLEYAEGTDGRWMPLDTVPQVSGQTSVTTTPGASVSVRGFITDLAGNQGTGSGQIILSAAAERVPPQASLAAAANGAGGTNAALNIPGVSAGSSPAFGANPFQAFDAPPQAAQPPTAPPVVQNVPPAARQAPLPAAVNTSGPAAGQTMSVPEPVAQSDFGTTQQNTYRPTAIPQNAAQQRQQIMVPESPGPGQTPGFSGVRSASGGQIVNHRVFEIAYEVQDVGPSGVSAVQLFVTENNGREWFRYGDDGDLRSPFQVDTRGEGTFGFEVRVRNGLGFSDPPPQPGDLPGIVVTVDQTPPAVELAVPQVIATGSGRISLNWQVSDAHLSAAPVRLEQAVSSSGPWTPVFDWQSSQGSHQVPIQPGMPSALYFRLLARDDAGNISATQTTRPVLIDQQRPTARFLSVQPVSRSRNY